MTITDALRGEHAVFYAQLDHLEQAVAAAGEPGTLRDLAALLASALGTHAGLEDALLFEPLRAKLADGAGLDRLGQDHVKVRGLLGGLRTTTDLAAAKREFATVIATAREHSAEEERTWYPLAEQVLGVEALEEMGREWAARRGVILA